LVALSGGSVIVSNIPSKQTYKVRFNAKDTVERSSLPYDRHVERLKLCGTPQQDDLEKSLCSMTST